MSQPTSAMHRSILCVDVADFSDRRRTDPDQALVRAGLYGALGDALTAAGVGQDARYQEDRGDGVLVLIHPDVPKCNLVTIFLQELARGVRRHNQSYGPRARIKLRLALHAGEVRRDAHGVVGSAVNMTFRLLNGDAVRLALGGSTGALALVASDWFFQEVIRHEPAAGPDAFQRVRIAVKETNTDAWLCLPDEGGEPRGSAHRTGRASEPATSVPRQLLAPVGNFVGRETELKALRGLLDAPAGQPPAMVVAVITGPAGVGKTALVMHWARTVRDHFPDGELYVNLRGYDPGPAVPPEEALDWMLRALDVDGEKIPVGLEAMAASYRSRLHGRRMLIVLDNAATVEQVRPLVPGTPGCVVMVTSRSLLGGFIARDGAHRIHLDRLTEDEAVALLRQIIGAAQVDAEPGAAATIALRCECLPLALRVAAQRAAGRPHASLAHVADELSGEQNRLDLFDTDDEYTGVRTAFSWSYRALPAPAAHMFRLLGLHRGPDISLDVVAALTDTTLAEARRSLGLLTGKHLVEESAPDRFRLHDLLRCYSEERAHEEETAQDRSVAVRRILVWYLHTAENARRRLFPSRSDLTRTLAEAPRRPGTFAATIEAQRWCETERRNLVAAVHLAVDEGHDDIAWRLTCTVNGCSYRQRYRADWIATHELALASARRLGDRIAEGSVLHNMGFVSQDDRFEESIGYYRRALEIYREVGERSGQGWVILGIGHAYRGLRRFEDSIDCYKKALVIFRETGSRTDQSLAHLGLGYAYVGVWRIEESMACFQQALGFVDDDRRTEGWALHGLGYGYRGLGCIQEAIDHYERALGVFTKIGDWWGQGEALYNLGKAQADLGLADLARQSWTQALAIFRDLHIDRESDVRARLDTCVAVSI